MENILESIKSPEDIKTLNVGQMKQLAVEIREFLINNISKTGGHLASNLGVVELTIALHKVFSTPKDKIVWDVGHQSYVHKIITGRKEGFPSLRQIGGLSGFPKTSESEHDSFNTGHSSTSISAALGMAKARDIKKEDYAVIAVIGDGALTGGMAYEALNDAGRSSTNLIVILNDNEMSIARNVGSMARYLSKIRTEPLYFKTKEDINEILQKVPIIGKRISKALDIVKRIIKYMLVPGKIFEELGFKYLGPIDGHNLDELTYVLSRAKRIKGPVLIHVCTQKGKGYIFAEEHPLIFHGVDTFEIETGEIKIKNKTTFSEVFGLQLVEIARDNNKVAAVTAAMPNGTGLVPFSRIFPDRFFDVGIAEQHAVTFAAGLAANGLVPVVAVYSSFLQRAYDQILHDVALQNLHVVFAVDRAGIVGEDGETHQGIYDISYLRHMPNICIMAPCDYNELRMMLDYAINKHRGPVAIRYPRGAGEENLVASKPVTFGKGQLVREGTDLTLVALGNMMKTALEVTRNLEEIGITVDLINPRFAKPLDVKMITHSVVKTGCLVTLEDNVIPGGFGSEINECFNNMGIKASIRNFGFPDTAVPHGSRNELYLKYGLDSSSLTNSIIDFINRSKIKGERRIYLGKKKT